MLLRVRLLTTPWTFTTIKRASRRRHETCSPRLRLPTPFCSLLLDPNGWQVYVAPRFGRSALKVRIALLFGVKGNSCGRPRTAVTIFVKHASRRPLDINKTSKIVGHELFLLLFPSISWSSFHAHQTKYGYSTIGRILLLFRGHGTPACSRQVRAIILSRTVIFCNNANDYD